VRNAIEEFNGWKDNPDPALTVLFTQYPENTNPNHVMLKVVALNAFYSTKIPIYSDRIPTVYEVVRHIVGLNIDAPLTQGQENVVELIANVDVNGRHQRNYSFATKYCNWHQQDVFPIYDSCVSGYLWHLKKHGFIEPFHRQDLDSYPKFKEIVKKFRDSFDEDCFNFKDIDKFLYVRGTNLLPRRIWRSGESD